MTCTARSVVQIKYLIIDGNEEAASVLARINFLAVLWCNLVLDSLGQRMIGSFGIPMVTCELSMKR